MWHAYTFTLTFIHRPTYKHSACMHTYMHTCSSNGRNMLLAHQRVFLLLLVQAKVEQVQAVDPFDEIEKSTLELVNTIQR